MHVPLAEFAELCQRLAETFGVRMPSWESSLDLVLESLAERAAKP